MSSAKGESSLGDVIRAWRTAHGWTVTELARQAGLSKGYISQVEHSKIMQPKLEQLARIASALGITEWDLINRRLPNQPGSPFQADSRLEDAAPNRFLQPKISQPAVHYQRALEDVLQRLRELEQIVEDLLQHEPRAESRPDDHQ